jgi:hypothetical protein
VKRGKELDHLGRRPDQSPEAFGHLDLVLVHGFGNKRSRFVGRSESRTAPSGTPRQSRPAR